MGNKALDYTALTLGIIGAINWGLIGFFNFNLVSFLFGSMTWISRIVYALVGLWNNRIKVHPMEEAASVSWKRPPVFL